jgi:hypothetical protein
VFLGIAWPFALENIHAPTLQRMVGSIVPTS